jgi:transcriptional regulator with XRE-family HTH domain
MSTQPGDAGRAGPLTRLLGRRVRELRKAAGMDQAALGDRMAKLRPGWSRSTVVKLENANRASLPIDDLPALGHSLGVPPVALLVDPKQSLPVGDDVMPDPWTALLWLVGLRSLEGGSAPPTVGADVGRRGDGELMLTATYQAWDAICDMERFEDLALSPGGPLNEQLAALEQWRRGALRKLTPALQELARLGMALPKLPAFVTKRAEELGVDLPVQADRG